MSNDVRADMDRPNQSVFFSTAVSIAICLAGALGFYLLGGKTLIERIEQSSTSHLAIDARSPQTLPTSQRTNINSMPAEGPMLQSSINPAEREARDRNVINAIQTANNTRAELVELINEISELQELWTSLQTNEAGRRVAVSTELLDQCAALKLTPVANLDDHARWKQQLEQASSRIETADVEKHRASTSVKSDSDLCQTILASVQLARESLRQRKRILNNIVLSASVKDPGHETLETALARRVAERDAEYLQQLVIAKQAAGDEFNARHTEQVLEEFRRQQDLLGQQKLAAERSETAERENELNRIKAAGEELRRKREKAQLLQEFTRDRTTIESLLTPFLDHAITQPSQYTPIGKGGIKRPTSLSALRIHGALKETNMGLDFLYHVGGHPANMRRKGSFPAFVQLTPIPNDVVRSKVRRAQQLLIQYGEILVEKGMLSP